MVWCKNGPAILEDGFIVAYEAEYIHTMETSIVAFKYLLNKI